MTQIGKKQIIGGNMANFIITTVSKVSYKNDNGGEVVVDNNPVNLDLVFHIRKTYSEYTKLFQIMFTHNNDSYISWFFETEQQRDEVFSSIRTRDNHFKYV